MSTSSNAVPDTSVGGGMTPAAMSKVQLFYWSVRRELWEHRSIYIAPLAAAGVFLFGFLISLIALPHRMRTILALDPAKQHDAIAKPFDMAAGLIMLSALIVAVFYCLDALYGERRDRSILFWKALPVSDLTTVLAKASVPLLLQVLSFAITFATYSIMLLLSLVVLAGNGLSVSAFWTQSSFFEMSFMLLYHLLTVHALWYAPIYAWLLLVSAWARRAPFLWAILPPLAIGVVEKIVFNTSYFAEFVQSRFAGGMEVMGSPVPGRLPIDAGMHITVGHFLFSPGLWLGLAVAAVFLYAASRLRRSHGPM